ncbi:MAG: TonB-dependent receptor, partial [Deltaproteobacteria bacterium]|jgi:iron complex outermembrane receptor protein|nr:TonB-dependent receptor [Deltaproteobacteria bacterium]MBW2532266.1 TonB-dependent receptor [Deltaproteobacteria bacterium]
VLPAERARAAIRRLLAGVTSRLPCSSAAAFDGRGRCELELSQSGMLSAYRLTDPDRELGQASSLRDQGQRLTQRARVRLPVLDWLDLRPGTSIELGRLQSDVMQRRALSAERYVGRLELSAMALPEGPLTVGATGAVECHGTDATGAAVPSDPGCDTLAPVGRLGARWQLVEPLSVFANLGRYVREPTLGELYGTSSVVRGNPDLTAEQGLTVDVGSTAEGRAGPARGYAQLVGFARVASDLIGYRRSSFSVIRPYNVGAARVLGIESAVGGDLWGILHASAAVTVLDPRDVSDDRQVVNDLLPFRARLVVAPQLEVAAPQGWSALALDRIALIARFLHRSSRVADPAGLVVLAEQNLLDLEVAARLHDETLRVRAGVENLLDQQTSDLVGYPLPGRSAHATMEAWW